MSIYEEPAEGAWVEPIRRGYKLACCDCGLVHRIDFRQRGSHLEFRVYRDNRATAMMRRWMRRSTHRGGKR